MGQQRDIQTHAEPQDLRSKAKLYYRLTKPGIIYGNLLSAIGGFLFAAKGSIDFGLLLAMAAGTSCIIASACVYNNYIDRDIDAHMARTKKRALVIHTISGRSALIFASLLGLAGVALLYEYTNVATLVIGLIGFVTYVGLYTYAKRHTVYATLIGSIPGATPIAAGYTAAAGNFDVSAAILFAGMVIWQMPHFYAIAMFRKDEYAAAKVPVLSVVSGMQVSKIHIVGYIALFSAVPVLLFTYSHASISLVLLLTALSGYWLWTGLRGFTVAHTSDTKWARAMFNQSLIVLLALSTLLSVNIWLP